MIQYDIEYCNFKFPPLTLDDYTRIYDNRMDYPFVKNSVSMDEFGNCKYIVKIPIDIENFIRNITFEKDYLILHINLYDKDRYTIFINNKMLGDPEYCAKINFKRHKEEYMDYYNKNKEKAISKKLEYSVSEYKDILKRKSKLEKKYGQKLLRNRLKNKKVTTPHH